MARISTYPIDNNLNPQDKWIGSDANNSMATKNFSLESVVEWLNFNAAIDSQTLRFKYQASATDITRKKGSISLEADTAGNLDFSAINALVFSAFSLRYASFGKTNDISNFYTNPLIGSYVLISDVTYVSTFGIFKWDSSSQKTTTPFYSIGLTYVTGNGSLENTKDYFISLLQYDVNAAGGDKTEIFNQGTAAKVWDITHSLDKFASVSVVDSAGETVYGSVDYISKSNITITFANAFSGQAFLN